MKIGIVGYGKVGMGVYSILQKIEELEKITVYDPFSIVWSTPIEEFPKCDMLFICVPTPSKEDGSCDTSIVEETLTKFDAKIYIIRSTVSVGFTEQMASKLNKNIVFMPEYGPSESPNHPFQDVSKINWAVMGGQLVDTKQVAKVWEKALYNVKVFHTDSKTAELVKLVENAYFFSKLTFLNQIYDLCSDLNVDYDKLRLLLTEDSRIEADHSFIHPDRREIGGRCLPKDMANLIDLLKKNRADLRYFETLVTLNNERK